MTFIVSELYCWACKHVLQCGSLRKKLIGSSAVPVKWDVTLSIEKEPVNTINMYIYTMNTIKNLKETWKKQGVIPVSTKLLSKLLNCFLFDPGLEGLSIVPKTCQ